MGFFALDKTIIYFLIFLVFRTLYNYFVRKKGTTVQKELVYDLFIFYILFVLFFTVFRKQYWPWQIPIDFHRSLSDVNWIPFVQTLKMNNGITKVALIYNFLGNIILFIPLGMLFYSIGKKPRHKFLVFLEGFCLSLFIETAQFFTHSGQADVDDLIFNSIGILIGLLIYYILFERKHKRKKRRKKK
ncbi:VanZ family protein [Xylocopilactobacillus apis]|nr:VanZ family protein [Xylocopilactobacillus apis]